MSRSAIKPFKLAELTWPLTEYQVKSLSDMLEDIYQRLKENDSGFDELDADNITSGTLDDARLETSGVTAGQYGDATHVPQVIVDNKGRVTSAVDVAISAGGANHNLLSSTHPDTTTASPTTGDMVIAQTGTVSDVGVYWVDGQALYYLPNANDAGAEAFWVDGLPAAGLVSSGTVKWARKANGASGYVWTAGATGPDWQPSSSGSSLGAAVYKAADFSLADRTATAVILDTEVNDDGDFWTSGTPTRLTVPVSAGGAYAITGLASWDSGSVGNMYAYIYVNGVKRASSAAAIANAPVGYLNPALVSAIIKLNSGDYVELYVEHAANSAGTSYTIKGGTTKTFLEMGRLNSESVVATGLPSPVAGALIKGNSGATAYDRVTIGAAGTVLLSDGAAPGWSTRPTLRDVAESISAAWALPTSITINSKPVASATPAFSAGDFTSNAGSWTVDAADVTFFRYSYLDKLLFLRFEIDTTTVAGGPTFLKVALPGGVTVGYTSRVVCFIIDNGGTQQAGMMVATATEAFVRIYKDATAGTAWTGGANNCYVRGSILIEVA